MVIGKGKELAVQRCWTWFSESSRTAFGRLSECSRSCAWVAQNPPEVALGLPGEPKIKPWRSPNRAKIAQGGQEALQGRPRSVPRASQERPRALQERPKSVPRASQERPRASKSIQERPRASQERPKSVPGATKCAPRATQERFWELLEVSWEPLGTTLE